MRKLIIAVLCAASLLTIGVTAASAAPPTVPVTSCGVAIPPHAVGVVQNDFNCTPSSAVSEFYGILLGKSAVLDLNGHTITLVDGDALAVVRCDEHCTVHGPGTITSTTGGSYAIETGRTRLDVSDLTITDMGAGAVSDRGTVIATRVSISATTAGIWTANRIRLDHVDVTLSGSNTDCIDASTKGGKVLGHDVTVTGCGNGVYATSTVNLTNLTVSNSDIGVFSRGTTRLTNSSVTGSSQFDLFARSKPQLVNTTCGTSGKVKDNGATSWGVCAND